ncbi:MAG: VOC family protein [Planctomycetota bacterium]
MTRGVAQVALVVKAYDEAIAYFTSVMGFELVEDTPLTAGKRWVVVRPPGTHGAAVLLAQAATEAQRGCIGKQTGGRVFLFLETEDFARDYARMKKDGVRFLEEPREESYGTVAVFEDLYGNKWDLLQRN